MVRLRSKPCRGEDPTGPVPRWEDSHGAAYGNSVREDLQQASVGSKTRSAARSQLTRLQPRVSPQKMGKITLASGGMGLSVLPRIALTAESTCDSEAEE